MRLLLALLTATAVLVWPGRHPVERLAPVRDSGATVDADAGSVRNVVPGRTSVRGRTPVRGGTAVPGRTPVPVAEVAGVIDLLALTLRGGVGLVEAMEAVAASVGGLLGLHLRTVAAAGRWGVDEAAAWASVPAAWQPAARALRMAATAGVPPGDALAGAADEVRRSEQQRLEVATATLGVRLVLPLGLIFLPAFILTTVVPIVLALAQQVLVDP